MDMMDFYSSSRMYLPIIGENYKHDIAKQGKLVPEELCNASFFQKTIMRNSPLSMLSEFLVS